MLLGMSSCLSIYQCEAVNRTCYWANIFSLTAFATFHSKGKWGYNKKIELQRYSIYYLIYGFCSRNLEIYLHNRFAQKKSPQNFLAQKRYLNLNRRVQFLWYIILLSIKRSFARADYANETFPFLNLSIRETKRDLTSNVQNVDTSIGIIMKSSPSPLVIKSSNRLQQTSVRPQQFFSRKDKVVYSHYSLMVILLYSSIL